MSFTRYPKYKDSGVEWLGEVPEHWEVSKLSFLSREVTVGIVVTPAKYYVDSGIPCLRSLNVKPGKVHCEDFVYISDESNVLLSKSMLYACMCGSWSISMCPSFCQLWHTDLENFTATSTALPR